MKLAPEPFLSAYLSVVRETIVFARYLSLKNLKFTNRINKSNSEQISDLLDAIHVIPELINNWDKCNESNLRNYLKQYDLKWHNKKNKFSMIEIFEEVIASYPSPLHDKLV